MKVFLDTNVVLDVLQEREPFYADSFSVLSHCEKGLDRGVVSALTFGTVAYILGRRLGDDAAVDLIADFRQAVSVSDVTEKSVDWAIAHRTGDFEDDMQYESAKSAQVDVIVTRDPDGFPAAQIRVMSPTEFMANRRRAKRIDRRKKK